MDRGALGAHDEAACTSKAHPRAVHVLDAKRPVTTFVLYRMHKHKQRFYHNYGIARQSASQMTGHSISGMRGRYCFAASRPIHSTHKGFVNGPPPCFVGEVTQNQIYLSFRLPFILGGALW